jgi:hypothetical protein
MRPGGTLADLAASIPPAAHSLGKTSRHSRGVPHTRLHPDPLRLRGPATVSHSDRTSKVLRQAHAPNAASPA